jgi:glycosyltransferase involved in cell wall biosynthesis
MVLVSVIMNAYNHEKYISDAIESILNQTFTDFELIIIDDASKDATPSIIKSYQQKDNRIRAIFHDKNVGIAKTMNECFKEAKGKYIAYISSDDVWLAGKLEKQLAVLAQNENSVVWSEGNVIDGAGAYRGFTFTQMHNAQGKQKSGNLFLELIEDNFVFTQSLIYKTEYAQKIGYDARLKYLNDYKYLVDLAAQHEFLYIPLPLAKYRVHGKNSICRDETDWLKDRVALRTYFLQKYDDLLSNSLKANLCLKIGEACAGLGQQEVAKRFFLKAIRYNFASKETILYLNHALTNADGWMGNVLLLLYLKLDAILLRRRQNK